MPAQRSRRLSSSHRAHSAGSAASPAAAQRPRLDLSQDCFTVTEAIRSYLPNALAAYLRLPKLYAQNQPLASGHTAAQTLLNQLLLLETSLQAIEKSAFEGDAEQLVINGQFLQNKFSKKLAFRS